jgi:hypothetical protein
MNDSSYSKAIAEFSEDERILIEEILSAWSANSRFGQRIVRNIERECFLSKDSMHEILAFILSNGKVVDNKREVFEKGYEELCYKHTLKGGQIEIKRPKFLGAAVEYEILFKHLKDIYADLGDDLSIKDFIFSLQQANIKLSNDRKNIKLKKYNMWSTWDEQGKNPFDYCITDKADEVRANMGLKREDAKGELLLFIYTVPTNIELFRPTIADAGLSQYFEPPVIVSVYGWTVTWPDDGTMEDYKEHIKPRPECIHEAITLGEVKFPIIMKL